MYQILLERHAEKDLKSLDKAIYKRVKRSLLSLKENPRPIGSKKLRDHGNEWRIRIGDWRILYEIDDKSKLVRIFRVKHRSKAYQ